jgi:hypothetical protein
MHGPVRTIPGYPVDKIDNSTIVPDERREIIAYLYFSDDLI